MSERSTRLLSLVALAVALTALGVAAYALRVSEDRTAEIERLREAIQRASRTPPAGGGRPPLGLDPGED